MPIVRSLVRYAFLSAVLLIAACASAGERAGPTPLDLPGFCVLGPRVAGGGQPPVEVLETLSEASYGLVINLRRPTEPLAAEEGDLVRAAGVAYAAMPLGGDDLTADHARRLTALLEAHPDGHVLLHCASGNRVGALWGLLVGLRDGLDVAGTLEVARASGMRSPTLAKCVRLAVGGAAGGR
ncbi:MAG: sulfur transferase domain-containing protein [Planctomycetota bacterium]|jgi:uncharacterized protein (TIGR01244 family)|nr:sulfur transferase domain-containing protein [Planctomycetota bacterium]MDP6761387.1 sulfur transferase domain-containing protein [Planctomycetota bacterium]MDP6989404.1 sulfur transferase domain-containing protein [Planctomycetota bacterium]